MEKVELTLKLSVKDLNRVIALTGLDLLTNEEQIKEYNGLTLDVSEIKEFDDESKIGIAGLFIAAKGVEIEKTDNA
jgi:hypothetical protein